jgi:hypothetical protein
VANVTAEPIFQVANGFMAAKYLFIASEVGLFERLAEGPATIGPAAAGEIRLALPTFVQYVNTSPMTFNRRDLSSAQARLRGLEV